MPFEDSNLKNENILDDVNTIDYSSVVYSRDWTIETIISQIKNGNIDLNPKFQRRNAWDDVKRSRLIESLIIGIPVPEIVLAEKVHKKVHKKNIKEQKTFLVIDGKQRLLTIAGFVMPETYPSWHHSKLKQLKVCRDLNCMDYNSLELECLDVHRLFLNADIRCTVISNYKSDDVLYDTYYRLNIGSAPLSTQDFRQIYPKG